ncbi:hypothetical protein RJ639_018495, partial [Escallonia herrerae]
MGRAAPPAQIPTSFGLAFAAVSSKPTISLESQNARAAPSLRWTKTTSTSSIAPPLILLGSSLSWIQAEVGLLDGFELENLFLVVTHLQFQRHFQRISRYAIRVSFFFKSDGI